MEWARRGHADRDAVALIPDWLRPVAEVATSVTAEELTRFVPQHGVGGHSADLVLFIEERDQLLI